jgi:hypothetical protein
MATVELRMTRTVTKKEEFSTAIYTNLRHCGTRKVIRIHLNPKYGKYLCTECRHTWVMTIPRKLYYYWSENEASREEAREEAERDLEERFQALVSCGW